MLPHNLGSGSKSLYSASSAPLPHAIHLLSSLTQVPPLLLPPHRDQGPLWIQSFPIAHSLLLQHIHT